VKFRTTLGLLIAVVVLGLVIVAVRSRHNSRHDRISARVLDMSFPEVSRLSIERGDLAVEFAKAGQDWQIVSPIRTRARPGAIEKILGTIEEMRRLEWISAKQMASRGLTLADYGLAEPVATFRLHTGTRVETLLVGIETPLEKLSCVRRDGEDGVTVAQTNLLAMIPVNLEAFRDRRLLSGEAANVDSIEITRPGGGFVKMQKKERTWLMQQPVKNARLDGRKMSELLTLIHTLHVEEFMSPDDLERFGLQDAIVITVRYSGDDVGTRIVLGKKVEDMPVICAKVEADGILGTVDESVVDALNFKASDLRDRDVFQYRPSHIMSIRLLEGDRSVELRRSSGMGWWIEEPRRWKADDFVVEKLLLHVLSVRISEFFAEGEMNDEQYGFNDAAKRIEISCIAGTDGEDENSAREKINTPTLLVGGYDEARGAFYARIGEDSAAVFVEDTPLLRVFGAEYDEPVDGPVRGGRWVNPIVYRDRLMLRLDGESVARISVLRPRGERQEVARGTDGSWQAVSPASSTVDESVVNRALALVAGLYATRLEYQQEGKPGDYGLDEGGATKLVFALTGEEGISKTLLFGSSAGSGEVYSMVQGQDVVFVLPEDAVQQLTRDLTTAGAGHGK
jgi:hypothetical protein